MPSFQKPWTDFKTTFLAKGLSVQFFTTPKNWYHIWVDDGNTTYECRVKIDASASSDQIDFENNYKADANQPSESFSSHIFISEPLVSEVYEDTRDVTCRYSHKTFNIENKNSTGSLKFIIYGSPNKSNWQEIESETLLAAEAKVSVVNNDFWEFVKVSAKGDNTASTIDCFLQIGQ